MYQYTTWCVVSVLLSEKKMIGIIGKSLELHNIDSNFWFKRLQIITNTGISIHEECVSLNT